MLRANAADVVTVPFPEGMIDIDTEGDLKHLA